MVRKHIFLKAKISSLNITVQRMEEANTFMERLFFESQFRKYISLHLVYSKVSEVCYIRNIKEALNVFIPVQKYLTLRNVLNIYNC